MATLTIKRIQCNIKEDYTGKDDIYLRVSGKYKKVGRFHQDHAEEVNKPFQFTNKIEVAMWEDDDEWFGVDPDDKLGSHTFLASDAGGGVLSVNYSGSGASYDLWHEIT